MKRLNVIGLESSGRHWVDAMLRQHPELEVFGISYPCLSWPDRFYPTLPTEVDFLVVVVRDVNCQEQSVVRRFFQLNTPEGKFTPAQNQDAVMKQVDLANNHGIKVLFFDYEAALVYQQRYMNWFFGMLGVPAVLLNTEWKNENKKYFVA